MPDDPPETPPEPLHAALRRARAAAGVSGAELARRSGYSQSTISRMERGDLAVSMLAAGRWAWYLRRPRAELRHLVAQAKSTAEDTAGLVPIRVVLQQGAKSVQRQVRLRERNVTHQSVFHSAALPGLLQTEAFIRLVMEDGDPDDATVPALVAERMQRQREAANRHITFVITEGTLHQGVPDAQVLAEQCDHLADLAVGHRFWRVGVIPRVVSGRWMPLQQNGFDLYDDGQVFFGFTAGNALVRDPVTLAVHVEAFRRLVEVAVFGHDAAAVFGRIAEEYRSCG